MHENKFSRISFVLILVSISAFSTAASSPLQYRTFISGPALWIAEPAGIIMYRNDTRSVRNIVLNDTVDNDTLRDIVQNGTVLWVLAASGVYQIDLSTTTVEKIPGGKKGGANGRIAVDDDYVWIGINDSLWRFDKLGREWFPYPIKSGSNTLCGMYSNGTNVYCAQPFSMKIFSTQDEKWREFPYPKNVVISPAAQLFLDINELVFADGASIYRYIINAQSWDRIECRSAGQRYAFAGLRDFLSDRHWRIRVFHGNVGHQAARNSRYRRSKLFRAARGYAVLRHPEGVHHL